jgi:hypothetical protein
MSKLPFPERVLHQHIATLGKTGAGKSSAMRVIAEHLLDKNRRVAIIDPKGDWWGLKSSADGKSAGYPVITFGNFKEERATDVPINEQSGKHVAELIATGNRPCVLGFRGWMPGQLTRFWLDFAPTLFNANEGELYVIIDEVHNFAPKGKIMDPQAGKCLHWTNRIMSEGRGLGLTFFVASQRPQKVHNDTLDNCETLIAMRVTHPRSRDAAEEWINAKGDPKFEKEVLGSLAQLKRGEAWVWSPENGFGPERVQFPMFQTFDSFAPPQVQKKVSQAGWAEVDLDQVKQKLATVIAEAKANDPKELKAEVFRLRQELAKKPSAPVVAKAEKVIQEKIVEVPAFSSEEKASLNLFLNDIAELSKQLLGVEHDVKSVESLIRSGLNRVNNRPPVQQAPRIAAPQPVRRTPPAPYVPHHSALESNGDLSRPQLKLIEALGEAEAIGRKEILRSWLAFIAGVSPLSSGFEKNVSTLSAKGMLRYPASGRVALTEVGRTLVPPISTPLTTESLLDRVCRLLSGPQETLLRVLHREYPNALTRSELARLANVSELSSGFEKNVSTLFGRELVEYPGKGEVVCADWLFIGDEVAA